MIVNLAEDSCFSVGMYNLIYILVHLLLHSFHLLIVMKLQIFTFINIG